MLTIDAERVRWRPAAGPDATNDLIVLMHGLGSNEHDLFSFAPFLPRDTTIASLRAPLPYSGGWAWFEFPITGELHPTIDAASEGVLAWLDGLEHRFDRVHLVGFSQGGAMAVQLARLAPERFASIAHLASFVYPGERPGDAALAARAPRIPVLSTIGELDDVIDEARVDHAIAWLDAHTDVERHRYRRGHGIVEQEIGDLVAFLERV